MRCCWFDATVVSGAGWTAVSGVESGANVLYTFVWVGIVNSADNTRRTSNLVFLLPGDNQPANQSYFPKTVIASATARSTTGAGTSAVAALQ